MRLIDADKVLDSYCYNCTQKSICEEGAVCDDRAAVNDALCEACTIDAEPVKHGTWIEKRPSRMKWIPDESDGITEEETTIEDMIEQKCSICQRWSIKFAHHIEMNFCPNCGAKMRKVTAHDRLHHSPTQERHTRQRNRTGGRTMKQTESRRRYFGRLMNQDVNGKDRTKARKRKKVKR